MLLLGKVKLYLTVLQVGEEFSKYVLQHKCDVLVGRKAVLGVYDKKRDRHVVSLFRSFELSYLDSNQDKQNQNLLCYHYTIGQSSVPPFGKAVQR